MNRFLIIISALLLTTNLWALDHLFIDDFTIPNNSLGGDITIPVKAHFDHHPSGIQIFLTCPEGLTLVSGSAGSDSYITYLDVEGNSITAEPFVNYSLTNNSVISISTYSTFGYWDPNGNGLLESYGLIKWDPGDYDEMFILSFHLATDFNGGDIEIRSLVVGMDDIRDGATTPNQELNHTTHASVETIKDLTGEIHLGQFTDDRRVYVEYTGPEDVTLTVTVDGLQVEIIDGFFQVPSYGEHEVIIFADATGYNSISYYCVIYIPEPEKTADPQITLVQTSPNQYYVQATGNGVIHLYLNGEEISNPYIVNAANEDITYVATATAQEEGKLISNTVRYEFTIPKAYDTDNYFTLPNMTALHRDTIVIPVSMINATNITAFQSDIYLPRGFQMVKDEYGDYMVELSSRKGRDHIIMASDAADGAITVISYSTSLKNYKGNEGELFFITIKVPEDAQGNYTLSLRNSIMTTSEYEELNTLDAYSTIDVLAYLAGDVNDSGTITVTDVVTIARYILDQHPVPFIFDAADMNGDGIITVTDLVMIARVVMTEGFKAQIFAPIVNGDHMSSRGMHISADETSTVSIDLYNSNSYTAFQFDLHLPEGLMASNFRLTGRTGTHTLDATILENGSTARVLCYSPALDTIESCEGSLLTFDVTATGDIMDDIMVDCIEMVTSSFQTVNLDAFTIKMDNATGVTELTSAPRIYNEGSDIIIECPVSMTVNVCDASGRVWNVNTTAGRNVIPTHSTGVFIVNANGVSTKLLLR